ncbi:MAG: hypothetical protein AAFW74_07910 [Pseudomonadota bacterium]
MKKFARTIVLATSLLAGTLMTPTMAQTVNKAEIEKIAAQLNLTEEQETKAKPIISEGVQERVSILKSAGIKRGTKPSIRQMLKVRGPIKNSLANTEARLSAVLNSGQMARYRVIVDEARRKMRAEFN